MASEACRALPAVVTTDYKPKGEWTQVGELNTYVTGNHNSKKAIIDIYDIFGVMPQTIQGADRLAQSLDAVVLMPDFFKGAKLDPNTFPPDTDEKKQRAQKFLADHADIEQNTQTLLRTTAAAKEQFPSVQSWGAFGLCWGGKIAVLASGPDTPYKVSGTAHPGRLAKEDALNLAIPHLVLASPGEPAEIVKAYTDIFASGEKVGEVETYSTMFHGWMGARADLQNEENAKEFERGYNHVARFFGKYL